MTSEFNNLIFVKILLLKFEFEFPTAVNFLNWVVKKKFSNLAESGTNRPDDIKSGANLPSDVFFDFLKKIRNLGWGASLPRFRFQTLTYTVS